jgi:hypothetical protein
VRIRPPGDERRRADASLAQMFARRYPRFVVPAKAGTQWRSILEAQMQSKRHWIPAFAGMTR